MISALQGVGRRLVGALVDFFNKDRVPRLLTSESDPFVQLPLRLST